MLVNKKPLPTGRQAFIDRGLSKKILAVYY